VEQVTGSASGGFALLGLVAFTCVAVMLVMSKAWEGVFVTEGGLAHADTAS
jgi:hypothetical protein